MSPDEILQLTEEDIKFQFITPAITEQAGWNRSNIRMEYYFTDGRITFAGKMHHKKKGKKGDDRRPDRIPDYGDHRSPSYCCNIPC